MTDTTYNVIEAGEWRAHQGLDQGRSARGRRAPAALECRAVAVHLQVGGGHAGRALGHRRDGGQRDSDTRRDHSGGGRRGYWLRHDGGADFSAREPSAGQPARHPHGDREGGAARPHRQRRQERPRCVVGCPGASRGSVGEDGAGVQGDRREVSQAGSRQRVNHLGTLGTGNHFIEVCLDENENVWFLLHSGSRGVGNRFGTFFIELAKNDMRQWMINLPDQDLAYLPQGTEHFEDYVRAVHWAQDYALANRELMMRNLIAAVQASGEVPAFEANVEVVSCHHNYVTWEHHYGENVLITRKGAVRAREGDMGIIPGSMGARSYIVRGKGNPESFMSCSHGAGRAMSRTEAKRRFTLDDHAKATAGVECRKDADVIDETPMAYKSIDAVMEAQRDLVDVVHTLRQVVCVKG